MNDFAEELKQYDEEWRKTEVIGGGARVPDGKYKATVTAARVERSQFGNLQFFTRYEVAGVGSIPQWDTLDHEIGMSYAKGRLYGFGWEGELSDLPAACEAGIFDDLECNITVKSKQKKDDPDKVYTQVYINNPPQGANKTVADAVQGDDDLPF